MNELHKLEITTKLLLLSKAFTSDSVPEAITGALGLWWDLSGVEEIADLHKGQLLVKSVINDFMVISGEDTATMDSVQDFAIRSIAGMAGNTETARGLMGDVLDEAEELGLGDTACGRVVEVFAQVVDDLELLESIEEGEL